MESFIEKPFAEQTILITGSAVRVGRVIALALAKKGYRIAIHYNHSEEEAKATVSEIETLGGRAAAFQADLSDPVHSAESLCSHVIEEFGSLDVLINNASVFAAGGLLDVDEQLWNQQLSVNLQAPLFLSREFVKGLTSHQSGHIINICDWRGERHPPGHDVYTITKAGLVAMTRMLARELAPQVRVNGLHPGAVLAPDDANQDHEERARETIPLNRVGDPESIARGVIYLLESPFVTGELLNITGGEHLT